MLEAGRRPVAAVIFLVLTCISGPIAAQDTLTVTVGERVRVSTESGVTHVGLLSAMTSGALEVQGEGGSQRFSVASVTRLDVSRGQKSHVFVGFLVGAGAGLVGSLAVCNFTDTCQVFSDNDVRTDVVLVSTGMGGLLGLTVGYLIKTERWEEIPLERLRVSLAPRRDGGFALGFSVRF